ncbi:VP3 [Rotavirus K]|nr:VP3 [Rotavirus K]
MRVLGLFQSGTCRNFADAYIFHYQRELGFKENAFLISNHTATTVIVENTQSIQDWEKCSDVLNANGIACVTGSLRLVEILSGTNFTLNWKLREVYLHEYSYYKYNEIRVSDSFWCKTIELRQNVKCIPKEGEYLNSIDGYKLYNTATDDDFFYKYIYEKDDTFDEEQYKILFNEKNFQNYVDYNILMRLKFAVPFDQLSNRITRMPSFSMSDIHVGLRNESIQLYLNNLANTNMSHYSANYLTVSDIENKTSQYRVIPVTDFDNGQFKNYMNALSAVIWTHNYFHTIPELTVIGSYPGYWISSLISYCKVFTIDPLLNEITSGHRSILFGEDDVSSVGTNTVYIDIRTDIDKKDWKKWRNMVEKQTVDNLNLAVSLLRNNSRVLTVVVKLTCMNIHLPREGIVIHFPSTFIKSEFYLLLDKKMDLQNLRSLSKEQLYYMIQNHFSDNVFFSKEYKLTDKSYKTNALYCLSNTINNKHEVIKYTKAFKGTCMTLRMNNTFELNKVLTFKTNADNTYLPTDIYSESNYITSYRGYCGLFGFSVSRDIKADGNNHLYILPKQTVKSVFPKALEDFDYLAGHFGISRHSHSKRFSESATTYSGYLFRDIVAGVDDLTNTDINNAASGHVYNAIIHFRYDYTFDILNWIMMHKEKSFKVQESSFYEEHSMDEIDNAIRAAQVYGILDNDKVLVEYATRILGLANELHG